MSVYPFIHATGHDYQTYHGPLLFDMPFRLSPLRGVHSLRKTCNALEAKSLVFLHFIYFIMSDRRRCWPLLAVPFQHVADLLCPIVVAEFVTQISLAARSRPINLL